MTRDELVVRWRHADDMRKQWEAYELECRRDLFINCFPNVKQGTTRIDLAPGFMLETTTGFNITLDNKGDRVDGVAQHIGKWAPSVFKWKPSLLLNGYKALPIEYKKLVDPLVTASPKTPSLKIIET